MAERLKILIIEDNLLLASLMVEMLSLFGYEVVVLLAE